MIMQASEEDGLEELKRLSREIGDKGRELVQGLGRARESLEQVEKKRLLWSVIRELKISTILDKLEPFGEHEIFTQVSSLKSHQSTLQVRRTVLRLIDDLAQDVNTEDVTQVDIPAVKKKLQVLSILMELIFYIE